MLHDDIRVEPADILAGGGVARGAAVTFELDVFGGIEKALVIGELEVGQAHCGKFKFYGCPRRAQLFFIQVVDQISEKHLLLVPDVVCAKRHNNARLIKT